MEKIKEKKKNNAQNAKQNQDFPNLPQPPRLEGASKVEEKQVKKLLNFTKMAEQTTLNKIKPKRNFFWFSILF